MHAANKIFAVDVAVGQQGAAVQAATVEHRHLVLIRPADHDEVDIGDEGVSRLERSQLVPIGYLGFLH